MFTVEEIKEYQKKHQVSFDEAEIALKRKEFKNDLESTSYIHQIKEILLEILEFEFGGYE